MKKTGIKLIIIVCLISFFMISAIALYIIPKKETLQNKIQTNHIGILNEINTYQDKYFKIIKRNNALLDLENRPEVISDLKELKLLFIEIKNKIDKDSKYLFEYEKIKNTYKQNNGSNTFEINEFAKRKFEAYDKLLNDTYKEIQNKLSKDDFEKLRISQIAWLKEVENYKKVFDSKGFGTIGTVIKYDYETNMRAFRTLLLMLYLN